MTVGLAVATTLDEKTVVDEAGRVAVAMGADDFGGVGMDTPAEPQKDRAKSIVSGWQADLASYIPIPSVKTCMISPRPRLLCLLSPLQEVVRQELMSVKKESLVQIHFASVTLHPADAIARNAHEIYIEAWCQRRIFYLSWLVSS